MKNLQNYDINFIDKTDIFIEVSSPRWRVPGKVSIAQLFNDNTKVNFNNPASEVLVSKIEDNIDQKTLVIDPETLKVKVNEKYIEAPSVFCEEFDDHNISYNQPPKSASEVSGMHMMTDGNYLYIWVESEKRWKRTILSEW